MNFQQLPTVLQDMVCDFGWKTDWNVVRLDLELIFRIKTYSLPPIFLRNVIYAPEYGVYIQSPLHEYSPLACKLSLFNRHRIRELLYKLDFRKKEVKCLGSRWSWIHAIDASVENILQLGVFYQILLTS